MTTPYFPIRQKPNLAPYKSGDVLVLFGELFNRGYANGLVEQAEKMGMKIVYATVGRRDKDGTLRPLNAEELANAKQPLINIPLEAGFDMEVASNGQSPIDQLKDIKLSEWENAKVDFNAIKESKAKGTERFRKNVKAFVEELKQHIPEGKNVLFAHLMAGGVPRAKIVMPLMNRVFKGIGDRNLSSKVFWESKIGQLCSDSFNAVTAETFRHLIELSTPVRENVEKQGGHVSYVAYGYHGTEIFFEGKLQWQSYSPYLQGWAKIELEKVSAEFHQKGINCCVYNCPEILTNSSSIFQGVEVPLYSLAVYMNKILPNHPETQKLNSDCQALLKDGTTYSDIMSIIDDFYSDKTVRDNMDLPTWPQHSTPYQLEKMIVCSEKIIAAHKDENKLMTAVLSEVVFKSCGYVMLHDSWKPQAAAAWIGHDAIVNCV